VWAQEVERAAAAQRAPPAGVEVWGNDVHRGALSLALHDVTAAGVQRLVRLHHGECRDWALPRPPALVVSNPPWGQRLRGRDEAGGGAAPASGEFTGAADEALQWWDAPPEERAPERRPQQPRQEEAEAEALRAAWWDLSSFLKRQAPGSTAFLLSGSPEATKGLRMKAERRHPLTLGGVDCRLLQYSVRGVDGGQQRPGVQRSAADAAATAAAAPPQARPADGL
jgi:23S rRNA G2445 N2-methylase RlmL